LKVLCGQLGARAACCAPKSWTAGAPALPKMLCTDGNGSDAGGALTPKEEVPLGLKENASGAPGAAAEAGAAVAELLKAPKEIAPVAPAPIACHSRG
jgi:hypothetical protein